MNEISHSIYCENLHEMKFIFTLDIRSLHEMLDEKYEISYEFHVLSQCSHSSGKVVNPLLDGRFDSTFVPCNQGGLN